MNQLLSSLRQATGRLKALHPAQKLGATLGVIVVFSAALALGDRSRFTDEERSQMNAAGDASLAAAIESGNDASFSSEARDWVIGQLRDPSSAVFTYTVIGHMNGARVLCGFVKGRNGFGGYGDDQRFIAMEPLVVLFDSGAESFARTWVGSCPRQP